MTQTRPSTWLRPLPPTLALLLACSPAGPTATDPPPGPPPPPSFPAPALGLRPAQATVNPLQTVQFEATTGGQPVAPDRVTWSIADTGLGQITPGGLLSTTPCYLGGSTTVRAVLNQDPAQQATAPVTVVVPAVALVQIQAINRASDHQPVDLQRVAGYPRPPARVEPSSGSGSQSLTQLGRSSECRKSRHLTWSRPR